jgi:thiol-disulfide isomerase/thioredoxin
MKKALLAAFLLAAGSALAGTVGQPAPDFTLADVAGKPVKLSDFRGRYVVLEWVNPECPYVEKHYGSANMQGLQKEFTAKQVVWLSINSTREGHYEYYPPQKMAGWMKQVGGAPSATLLDPSGKVGRAYQARTTPHMYIVDPKGVLVYAGGIDDKRSTSQADVKTAKNYVRAAMGEALAGKAISAASTAPYGCSIKY